MNTEERDVLAEVKPPTGEMCVFNCRVRLRRRDPLLTQLSQFSSPPCPSFTTISSSILPAVLLREVEEFWAGWAAVA